MWACFSTCSQEQDKRMYECECIYTKHMREVACQIPQRCDLACAYIHMSICIYTHKYKSCIYTIA